MSVYYIGTYDIIDADEFQKYPPLVMALLPKYGGEVLASDTDAFVVEGCSRTMNAIIKFPSREAALGLYHDPALSGGQTYPAGQYAPHQHGPGQRVQGRARLKPAYRRFRASVPAAPLPDLRCGPATSAEQQALRPRTR